MASPRHRDDSVLEAVERAGCPDGLRDVYVAFGHELLLAMTRAPVPEFEDKAKAVVLKWFERGLSGRKLWLIGAELVRQKYGRVR